MHSELALYDLYAFYGLNIFVGQATSQISVAPKLL